MEKAYYKASKKTSDGLFETWKKFRKPVSDRESALIDKYAADGLLRYGDCVSGFVVAGEEADDRRGMNSRIEEIDGKTYTVFTANRRFKEGKELSKDCDARNDMAQRLPCFSDWICGKFSIHRSLCGSHSGSRSGMALYKSVAGFAKGHVLIIVPVTEKDPAPHIDGFRRIKKSEYIALTEE